MNPIPRMNPKERRELAISEIVLIVLAAIGLGVVVWLAWSRPLKSPDQPINSFASCRADSASVTQESYPEVCVTKEGKRFVNPDQKVELPSASGTENSGQTDTASRKKITITQWNVQYPYPDSVKSLSYKVLDAQSVRINLDDVPGDCKGMNTIRRATKDQDLDGSQHTPQQVKEQLGTENVKQIGDHYYMFTASPESCTTDNAAQLQINKLSTDFAGSKIRQLVLAP